jgi:hypothetical protein
MFLWLDEAEGITGLSGCHYSWEWMYISAARKSRP